MLKPIICTYMSSYKRRPRNPSENSQSTDRSRAPVIIRRAKDTYPLTGRLLQIRVQKFVDAKLPAQ